MRLFTDVSEGSTGLHGNSIDVFNNWEQRKSILAARLMSSTKKGKT